MDGKPVYNNGLLVQNAKKGKVQNKNNPQIKSLNFPTKDSVFNTIVQVTKYVKGNTMKQWNQNNQVQKRMNPKKIVQKIDTLKLNYREDNKKLFLYDINEESKIISKRFIGLRKEEEAVTINVDGRSIEVTRIWTMYKLSNTSYLVEFSTEGEDYQINYTVDGNNNGTVS